MNWLFRTLSTSVGKKQLMAVTGLLFLLFLATHLLGNLSVYGGGASFVAYAEHLHALGNLLVAAEVMMAAALIIHVCTAVVLFFQNRSARPVKYAVDKSGGGRTFCSQAMPYTGLLVLGFIGVHLATFSHHIVDQTTRNIFQIAADVLSHKGFLAIYLIAMVIVALHVRHGLWSAFQTVGASHPKYMPFIQKLSLVFAIIVAIGFGSLPIVILSMR